MSEEPPSTKHESRWLAWTLGVVAVPVLYVLLLPPLFYGTEMGSSTGARKSFAPWLYVAARPYGWLCRQTPLRGPLGRYSEWWEEVYLGKRPLTYK